MFFIFVPDPHPVPFFGPPVSGSVRQRYGSADLDPHPDSYQRVTNPQHWVHMSAFSSVKSLYCTFYCISGDWTDERGP
jgi:hypothetical protein